jgi:hypothetical protein
LLSELPIHQQSITEGQAMLETPALIIAKLSRCRSTCALALFLMLSSVGCVDTVAIDHQKCVSKGFVEATKDYEYCRAKLQQIRDEEHERQLKFMEMVYD